MITQLTAGQEAAIPDYVNKWSTIGFQTGEADLDLFNKYMPVCYEKAGYSYPDIVIKVKSPYQGALYASIAQGLLEIDPSISKNQLEKKIIHAKKNPQKILRNLEWQSYISGQFSVGGVFWGISFTNFLTDVCGLKLNKETMEQATAYRHVCESVGYIWCNTRFVIVCDRPSEIHRNDQGHLHNKKGMSIKFSDGWGLYCWNGITVPDKVILAPETITIQEIQNETNQEVRRILIERYGVGQYLSAIDAQVVDVDLRGVSGGGARTLIREPDTLQQWLCVTDGSTNRVYHLLAPPHVNTCREAHQALCGFDEHRIKAEG